MEQRKDDARRLNKRHAMEMNVHMAHMFYVATQQALLQIEQRTATLELIYIDLGVEFGKFETEPYVKAMKAEVEISYPNDIVDIIRTKKLLQGLKQVLLVFRQSLKVLHLILLCGLVLCLRLELLLIVLLWVNKFPFYLHTITLYISCKDKSM